MNSANVIRLEIELAKPPQQIWSLWSDPVHVCRWNQASPDWHCPKGESDLTPGGRFNYRMEAKDGSAGFDYTGQYSQVIYPREIHSLLDDGRKVKVTFSPGKSGGTILKQEFETENTMPIALQQQGWLSILESFKAYADGLA